MEVHERVGTTANYFEAACQVFVGQLVLHGPVSICNQPDYLLARP